MPIPTPLLLLPAHAEPPVDLGAWEEVRPVREARGGVLEGGAVWVRTATGCEPGRVEAGNPAGLRVRRCEVSRRGLHVACDWTTDAGQEWGGGMLDCEWSAGDRTGGWGTAYGSSHHGWPVLVALDDTQAVWRAVFTVAFEPEQNLRRERPCTPDSLAAVRAEVPESEPDPEGWLRTHRDVWGERRRCDVSEGLTPYIVPVGYGRGVGLGVGFDPTPVDCREPCSPNETVERVRAANAWVAGRTFADPSGRRVALYRDRAACLASPAADPDLGEADCDPADPPWRTK